MRDIFLMPFFTFFNVWGMIFYEYIEYNNVVNAKYSEYYRL